MFHIDSNSASSLRSQSSARQSAPSYFVVMIDYGKRGREAIVDPEITRREVVSRLVSGEYGHVNFIHEIRDGLVEDVSSELFNEAEAICRQQAAE